MRIRSRRFNDYFFQVIHATKRRARGEVMLERLDAVRGTFCQCFNPAIFKIAYIPRHLMTGRGALSKKTITNALHFTAD